MVAVLPVLARKQAKDWDLASAIPWKPLPAAEITGPGRAMVMGIKVLLYPHRTIAKIPGEKK